MCRYMVDFVINSAPFPSSNPSFKWYTKDSDLLLYRFGISFSNLNFYIINIEVPIETLGILHICKIWILLREFVVYHVRLKFHLPAAFGLQTW